MTNEDEPSGLKKWLARARHLFSHALRGAAIVVAALAVLGNFEGARLTASATRYAAPKAAQIAAAATRYAAPAAAHITATATLAGTRLDDLERVLDGKCSHSNTGFCAGVERRFLRLTVAR